MSIKIKRTRFINILLVVLLCYLVSFLNFNITSQVDETKLKKFETVAKPQVIKTFAYGS